MGYDVNLVVVIFPNFVKTDTKEQRRIEATMSAKVMGSKQPEFLDLSPDEIIFSLEICGLDRSNYPQIRTGSSFHPVR